MSSIISTNAYGDLNIKEYAWRWQVPNNPNQSFGFTFATDKGHYTFIPDDFIGRGMVVNGTQYYSKNFLNKSTLETLYTQYQPIDFGDFKGFGHADTFYQRLKENGFGTSGVLVPESWTVDTFHKNSGMNWYEIGKRVGDVTLGAIQGMGQKDGQMVYVPTSSGADKAAAWITGAASNDLNAQWQPPLKWYQKLAREISKVPLLPELAALGATFIPGGAAYAPYIYAGLKGAALGAQGVDPLKAGLMIGINLGAQNLLANTALATNIGASLGATTAASQLAVGRIVLGAGVGGVQAGVQGGDITKGMLNGAIGGGATTAASFTADILGKNADGLLKSITDNTNLTRVQAQNIIASSFVSGLVAETRGGDFGDVFVSNLVNAGVTQSAANKMRDTLPETVKPATREALVRGVSTVAGTAAEAAARGQNVDEYLKANLPNILQTTMQAYQQEQQAIKEGWKDSQEKAGAIIAFGNKVTPKQVREAEAAIKAILDNPNVDDQALNEYIKSGILNQKFVESYTGTTLAQLRSDLSKRNTTEDEAKAFFKQVFGRDAKTPEELAIAKQFVGQPETQALRGLNATNQIEKDAKEFVYDGSRDKTQAAAEAEAKARGYNTYTFGGKTYTIMPSAELAARSELVKKVLQEQGKTIGNATDAEIQRAVDIVSRVPQQVINTASIQDIIKGNYSGWKDGKYYSYAGDKLQSVSVLDPKTGKITLERVEVRGTGSAKTLTPVVVRSTSLQDLASTDPEAYLQLASKFDAKAKGDMGDVFTNSLNAAVLAAQATGNRTLANNLQQTLAIGTQGIGEQVENIAKFFSSVTGAKYDNSVVRAAKALQEWGAANQSASTKAQEEAIMKAVGDAKGVKNKIVAFAKSAKDNPGGFFTMVAKEVVQEALPLWAARGVMTAGKLAAYSTNAAIEGIESWGSNAGEVYETAIKQGRSEAEARAMASKVGFQSFVVTSVTNGIGDVPVVRKIIGDGVSASFGDILKGSGREAVTEYFDELLTNANNQRALYGKVNWDHATTAATIGAGIGAGTTAGILTGMSFNANAVVAKDVNGKNVTLTEFLEGTKNVNMSTVNLNTTIGTTKSGNTVTLGTTLAMPMVSGVSYSTVTAGVPSILQNQNIVVGKDALGNNLTLANLMSKVDSKNTFESVYKANAVTTVAQRTEAQKKLIEQSFKNAGYTTFTAKDVESLLNVNKPGGTQSFVTAAQTYAAPRVVESYLKEAGYKATPQEIQTLLKQTSGMTPEQVRAAMNTYADPRVVTEAEARAAYEALGLKRPTEADVRALMGQYDQSLLGGKAESSLDRARYNSIMFELDNLAKSAGVDPSVLDAIKSDLNSQITALGGDLAALRGDVTTQISDTEKRLSAAINEARLAGLQGDAALESAINKVAKDLGTTKTDVLKQLGTTEARLRQDFAAQISGVQTQITDVESRLQKAVADAEARGLTRDQAIQAALETVSKDLGTTRADLLNRLGTTEDRLRQEFGAGLSGVSAEVRAAYDALSSEQKALANALAAQGISLTAAISEAQRQTQGQIGALQADLQVKYNALSDSQKALAEQLAQQGVDLSTAIDLASRQAAEALAQTEQNLTGQIQQVADILGKPARQVTQADIDFVTQMLADQQTDLAYDANQDGIVNQADIEMMTRLMAGNVDQPWVPGEGTVWAPTGLYKEQLESEKRMSSWIEEQANQTRRQQLKGQARQGLMGIAQQLPQAVEQSTRRIDPIYAQTRYHSFQAPLFQTNLWGEQPVQTPTNQPNQFRMASGGYLDPQDEPQTWDDIYRMLK
jgi:predicted transcriptional regulator